MAFLETPRFPDDVAYGSSFKTRWNTSVIITRSGHEQRNQNWSRSRKSFDVGYGIRSLDQLYAVAEFYEAVRGRLEGFRFKDWSDYKSVGPNDQAAFTDIQIGTGTGSLDTFQLFKVYTKGALSASRDVNKPVNGTILIGVNGVQQTETTHYTIDYSTGVVTFVTPPPNTHAVTWGGEFDVPCRFDVDELEISYEAFDSGNISIPVVEIRI